MRGVTFFRRIFHFSNESLATIKINLNNCEGKSFENSSRTMTEDTKGEYQFAIKYNKNYISSSKHQRFCIKLQAFNSLNRIKYVAIN